VDERYHRTEAQHSACRPDFVPPDFYLFGSLKEITRGRC